jgi:trimeric autotransporter adhesin
MYQQRHFFSKVTVLSAAICGLTACGGSDKKPENLSELRVLHASVDAPKVKVTANGKFVEGGAALDYASATSVQKVSPGKTDLVVKAQLPGNQEADVLTAKGVDLAADKEYEVFAVGSVAANKLEAVLLSRPETFDTSKVRVSVAHLAPDAPTVDIHVSAPDAPLSASTRIGTASYKQSLDPLTVAPGDYRIRITLSGGLTAVYDSGKLTLAAADDWVIGAIPNVTTEDGAAKKSPVRLLLANDKTQINLPSTTDGADLRVVHNSADAPAVDIVVNNDFDKPLVKNLAFPNFTGYVTVPAASYNVKVAAAGTKTTVINADLNLESGKNYSVIALDKLAMIAPIVVPDSPRKVATEASLRVIHGSSLAGTVDIYLTAKGGSIASVSPAISNFEFKKFTPYIGVAPGTYDITVTPAGKKDIALGPLSVSLEKASIYTVLARDEVGLGSANVTLMDNFNP